MSASQSIKLVLDQLHDVLRDVQALESHVRSLQDACDAADARAEKAKHTCNCSSPGSAFAVNDAGESEPERKPFTQEEIDAAIQQGREHAQRNDKKASSTWQVYKLKSKEESLEDKVKIYLGMHPYDDVKTNKLKNSSEYLKQLDAAYGQLEVDLMIGKVRGC